MKKVRTSASDQNRTLKEKARGLIQQHYVKKELEAFRSIVGIWEYKDTSFFDKR